MSETESVNFIGSVEASLRLFAEAPLMEQKIRALKELMKGGRIHAVRSDLRFAKGVQDAVELIGSAVDRRQKLLAVSVVARIASRIKAMRANLRRDTGSVLQRPMPTLSLLGEAEDRLYVAQALDWASGDWVIPFLAQAVVEEESGEKVRSQLVRTLLDKAPDLASALEALRKPLAEWTPETDAPGDSAARRLKRILASFRTEIVAIECPAGNAVGEVIERLISNVFRNVGPPTSPDVSADVTTEIALFLHDIVRTKFSLAAESSTYQALGIPSRWFLQGRWPEGTRKARKTLSSDIEEAIALLAKQGVADDGLLKALALVEGSRDAALLLTSRLADRTSGLTKEVADWLRRGRAVGKVSGIDLVAESSQLAADPALALLLLDSRRLVPLLNGPGQDLLNEVRIFEQNLEAPTAMILNRAMALIDGINALASKRSLRVRGEVGEVINYSPIEHEGARGPIVGSRRVRIVRPLVERVQGSGAAEVLIKAAVEPE